MEKKNRPIDVCLHFPSLSLHRGNLQVSHTSSPAIQIRLKQRRIIHYLLMELHLHPETSLRMEINITEVGLYYFLISEGNLSIVRQGAEDISWQANTTECQVFYLKPGQYYVQLESGKHSITCFAVPVAWFELLSQVLPVLNSYIQQMHRHQVAIIFPRHRLAEAMATWIADLKNLRLTSRLDLNDFHSLNNILAQYDQHLQELLDKSPRKTYQQIVVDFYTYSMRHMIGGPFHTVAQIAAEINCTPKTLARAFAAVTNREMTPAKFYHTLRMKTAVRLLTAGEPIAQVAEQLGYADTPSFSKAYFSCFGHNPSLAKNNPNAVPK
ncbi:AraC family transcriptional regulator [Parapedobacter koreensis]|nr:helix-turn-helix domain-containing protein [Parapedobacter koreensis]